MNDEDKKKAAIAFGEQFAKAAIPIACVEIESLKPQSRTPLVMKDAEILLQNVIDYAFRAGELYTEALFKQAEKAGLQIHQQYQQSPGGLIQVPRPTNNSN